MFLQPVVHKGSRFPARMSTLLTAGRRKVMQVASASVPLARTWSYGSSCKKPGKCSLYFGQPVPRMLFLKNMGIVRLRENWQPATITYHMRLIVWASLPQLEAAGASSLSTTSAFFITLSSEGGGDDAFREV